MNLIYIFLCCDKLFTSCDVFFYIVYILGLFLDMLKLSLSKLLRTQIEPYSKVAKCKTFKQNLYFHHFHVYSTQASCQVLNY